MEKKEKMAISKRYAPQTNAKSIWNQLKEQKN